MSETDLNERKLKILQAIVGDFICSAEPIGSRTLSKKYDMGISPATIRNEMSDLEEMGYLTHPHTSAGRVPSSKAYRLYVDNMMRDYELPEEEKKIISKQLTSNLAELDRTIAHAATLLSQLTNLTSFAITPRQDSSKLKYVNILPVDEHTVVLMIVAQNGKVSNTALKVTVPYTEDNITLLSKMLTHNFKGRALSDLLTLDIIKALETDLKALSSLAKDIIPNFLTTLENMLNVDLYMEGLTNIFSIPEYNDLEKAKLFLEMINRKDQFRKVLTDRDSGIVITIGDENTDRLMSDCSLITADYHINGQFIGKLGVIGPTRMKYAEITSVVKYMTENISKAFGLEGEEDE